MIRPAQELSGRGEIMRRAQLLIKGKGDAALDYSNKMAARKEELGEEEDLAYWEKIAKQVELLLYETD